MNSVFSDIFIEISNRLASETDIESYISWNFNGILKEGNVQREYYNCFLRAVYYFECNKNTAIINNCRIYRVSIKGVTQFDV